ncbi:MAG: 50S ribosomal protein L6 [Bacteroidota bacterium]
MSRIGKKPIAVPDKVQISIENGLLTAKGPKGVLTQKIPEGIECTFENKTLTFQRPNDEKKVRSLHGLSRALVANTVEGVTNGFQKTLQIIGVGYKAEMKGNRLLLALGFSHPVLVLPPDGIEFVTPNPNTIIIKGIDKQLIGEVSATIRRLRKPEPYKGKGIRYEGEFVRHKTGKTTAK